MALDTIRKAVGERVEGALEKVRGLKERVLGERGGNEPERGGEAGRSKEAGGVSSAQQAVEAAAGAVAQGTEKVIDKATELAQRANTALQDREPLDALTLLKRDHDMVAGLFDRLESREAQQQESREGLFAQLMYELDVHASAEEKLFYPRLKRGEEGRDLVAEALEEHRVMKQLLTELSAMAMDDAQWLARLRVLKEAVQQHVREEESKLFAQARDTIDEEERRNLGAQLLAAKKAQTQLSAEREAQPAAGAERRPLH